MILLQTRQVTRLESHFFRIMATPFGFTKITELISIYSDYDPEMEQKLNWKEVKISKEDLRLLRDSKGELLSIQISYDDGDTSSLCECVASHNLIEDLRHVRSL